MPPETFIAKDFSAGWTPSDSPINGRLNGLLVMDNLDIDAHGEVRLVYGTKKVHSTDYGTAVHTLFSKFIGGGLKYYAATAGGKVFRGASDISSVGGSTTRAAFGAAYDRVFICSGNYRVSDTGSTPTNLGIATPTITSVADSGVTGLLTGTYDYKMIKVQILAESSYEAKSAPSAVLTLTIALKQVTVTTGNPGAGFEFWVFRRGETLGATYYRVGIVTSGNTTLTDNLIDIDAITIGRVLNENIISIASGSISDPILEMVGLVFGRMIYFTQDLIYFSEIASPDTVDPEQAIAHSGDDSELFLWARLVGENTILVATTKDLYILTGTFITTPDGILDVSLRPLGVEARPLSRDAAVYNGRVLYFSTYGWRSVDPTGISESLVIPNTDRMYRGEAIGGENDGSPTPDYYGVPSWAQDTLRYSIAVSEERAWCRTPTLEGSPADGADTDNFRLEVLDLAKRYWHNRTLAPELLHSTEENAVVGVFKESSSYYLYFIDHFESKRLDFGAAGVSNQTIKLKTIFHDTGNPRNRKESTMLLLGIDTGNVAATIAAFKDGDQATSIALGTVTANGWTEKLIDINSAVGKFKNLQIYITVATTEFRLTYIAIEYNPFPDQVFRYIIDAYDFGELSPNKKRVRVWPILIDTLGQNVTATPSVDGSNLATQTLNKNGKLMELIHIKTDAFGIDYGLVLSSTNPFEVWKPFPPQVIQALPLPSRFDQIGPVEMARYGRIIKFEIRIIAFGGTTIPYDLFIDDTSEATGNITVVASKESTEIIKMPQQSLDGNIVRLVLGPTSFDFHRIYTRLQVMVSGSETDNVWITLEETP